MAKVLVAQHQFNAGEWSPRMYSRDDLGTYSASLRQVENCIVQPQGPVRRRNGSKFVAYTKDHDKVARLVRFQFSKDDSFILEFGDLYIRFYTNEGQVLESSTTITNITQANPGVVSITAHGYEDGDHVYIKSVVGMTEVNSLTKPYIVANKNANDFELTDIDGTNVDTSGFTAYSSAGTAEKIFEIVSPYDDTEAADITWAPFGSSIYISHPDFEPRVLTKISTTNWTLATLNAKPPPLFEPGETPDKTLTPAATTGAGVTFTAGSVEFLDADVGRQILNLSAGETGIAVITALGAASPSATATCDIVEDFTDTNAIASGDWQLDLSPISELTPTVLSVGSIVTIGSDLISSTTASETFRTTDVGKYIIMSGGVIKITVRTDASTIKGEILKSLTTLDETGVWTLEDEAWDATRGFPRAVGIFQERLVFGGSLAQPQNIWMSETGIFTGFGTGAQDADSIDVILGSSEINQVNWIDANRDLIIGTAGGEITMNGGSLGAPITPSTVNQLPRTSHGSQRQKTVSVGEEVLFLQQSARKIRTFRFDFNVDTYAGEDLTFLSDHLTEGGIKQIAYSQEVDSIIYAVTNNGDLLAGAYNRAQGVMGWAKFTTDGDYESVATTAQGEEDQVWVIVERQFEDTVPNDIRRMVEFFDNSEGLADLDGFSDSYLTLSSNLTITDVTAADPAVVTSTSHGLSDGDEIIIKNLVDPISSSLDTTKTNMSSLNSKIFTVANKTANTIELNDSEGGTIDTSGFNAYGSAGDVWLRVTAISGLEHLNTKSVEIKVDGASHDAKTVIAGTITLDEKAGEVVIGLPYTTTIKTMNKNFDIGTGTMQAQRSRWVTPTLRLNNSTPPTLNGQKRPAREGDDFMDRKVPLFSGDLIYASTNWNATGFLTIALTGPFPLHLTGIFGTIEGGVI